MNVDTQPGLTDSDVEIVAEAQRRSILRYLSERGDEPVMVHELAIHITDRDSAGGPDYAERVERNMTALHHVHLPKLDDARLVDYEAREKTVRYSPRDAVEELLQIVSETQA